ncbi:hypothetical protein ACFVWG_17325 [Kribbella sp. NPDC058245]|uniref:hypothetical protein n=1 Tax=Kribbella sp. NPDC058245 TaxID=3346399 RepID=UPI0036E971A4
MFDFDGDLTDLSNRDLLESVADHIALSNRCDTRVFEHALVYADRFHPDHLPDAVRPGRRVADGRERAVVYGGEGCPPVAEFAVDEFGVVIGVSPRVAARYIGNALGLRHRFPQTWAKVLAGEATAWKAARIVDDCTDLSEEAARYVDARVAGLIDSITPGQLARIVRAAKYHADPDQARAQAAEKARERGVFTGQADEHGTATMYIRAGAGDIKRHKVAIRAIADALKDIGDPRTLQARQATAVGIIADPRYHQELLAQAANHPRHTTNTPAEPNATQPASTPSPASARSSASAPSPASAPGPASAPRGASEPRPTPDSSPAPTSTPSPAPAPAVATPTGGSGVPPAVGRRAGGGAPLVDDPVAAPAQDRRDRWHEPSLEDEADRDAPHPSTSDLPDPLDNPPTDPGDGGEPLDAETRRALAARLAQIRHDAYNNPSTPGTSGVSARPGKTEIYIHLTDHTLATGTGVLRAETIGPQIADQLTELIGYAPYTVKPVIDLNQAVSANAYEIPLRIREHVKLTHPVELFPYGTRETTNTLDLDHIHPYDPLGPPGQTSTDNLAPLSRHGHRVKTHARGWTVHRLNPTTLEWTTPHGFTFHVTPTGTHRITKDPPGVSRSGGQAAEPVGECRDDLGRAILREEV